MPKYILYLLKEDGTVSLYGTCHYLTSMRFT